ncbi:MAG: glycosyltransferase [Thaumarchaeota archaeon]|nr:glycosyltransferase [Nitrososphaerota archaeon]
MSQPLISILIPTYNREDVVEHALISACSQTYPTIEIVVCDNASADRTFEIVQAYARKDPRIRCYRNSENIGPVGNWLRCLAESRGELIKILFSDDWLEPEALEQLAEPLIADSTIGFVYAATDIHGLNKIQKSTWGLGQDYKLPTFKYLTGFITGNIPVPFSPSIALFRRTDVVCYLTAENENRLELDCARYGMGNDSTLYLQACYDYPFFYHISQTLIHICANADSITVKIGGSDRVLIRYCYMNAFARALAKSNVRNPERCRLHSLLFLKPFVFFIARAIAK